FIETNTRPTAVWSRYSVECTQAIALCREQDGRIVVDEHRALRDDMQLLAEARPESVVFFGVAQIVGTDDDVEGAAYAGQLQFACEALWMGVRGEDQTQTASPCAVEQSPHPGADTDEPCEIALDFVQIDTELVAPVV